MHLIFHASSRILHKTSILTQCPWGIVYVRFTRHLSRCAQRDSTSPTSFCIDFHWVQVIKFLINLVKLSSDDLWIKWNIQLCWFREDRILYVVNTSFVLHCAIGHFRWPTSPISKACGSSCSDFVFNVLIFTPSFCFAVLVLVFILSFSDFWFSLRNFNLYYENQNQNQNLITTFENQKHKNKNQNRHHRPSCFAGGSIWRIEVSIWRSVALLTMLAHVNYLILPPLIALNQIVSFFQRIF